MREHKEDETNYVVIDGLVSLFADSLLAVKDIVRRFYALSLKGLSSRKNRNVQILLTDVQAFGERNNEYCQWQDDYNEYGIAEYDNFLASRTVGPADVNIAATIKKMRGILGGKKNCKRAKNGARRLYKDIKKVCNVRGISRKKNNEFREALRIGWLAHKEAVMIVRTRLRSELHQQLPDDLSIVIGEKSHVVKKLYEEVIVDGVKSYYRLTSDIKFSKDTLRSIQLAIYPHIFKNICDLNTARRRK